MPIEQGPSYEKTEASLEGLFLESKNKLFETQKISDKEFSKLCSGFEIKAESKDLGASYGSEGKIASEFNLRNRKIYIYPEFAQEENPEFVIAHELGEMLLHSDDYSKELKSAFEKINLESFVPEWVKNLKMPGDNLINQEIQKIGDESIKKAYRENLDLYRERWQKHFDNQIYADLFAAFLTSRDPQKMANKILELLPIQKKDIIKNSPGIIQNLYQEIDNNWQEIKRSLGSQKSITYPELLSAVGFGIDEGFIAEPNREKIISEGKEKKEKGFFEEFIEFFKKYFPENPEKHNPDKIYKDCLNFFNMGEIKKSLRLIEAFKASFDEKFGEFLEENTEIKKIWEELDNLKNQKNLLGKTLTAEDKKLAREYDFEIEKIEEELEANPNPDLKFWGKFQKKKKELENLQTKIQKEEPRKRLEINTRKENVTRDYLSFFQELGFRGIQWQKTTSPERLKFSGQNPEDYLVDAYKIITSLNKEDLGNVKKIMADTKSENKTIKMRSLDLENAKEKDPLEILPKRRALVRLIGRLLNPDFEDKYELNLESLKNALAWAANNNLTAKQKLIESFEKTGEKIEKLFKPASELLKEEGKEKKKGFWGNIFGK